MKNYFAFTDESGNSTQERYFGLGMLLIDSEIGDFYDAMKPYYEKVFSISRAQKAERIKDLTEQGEIEQINKIANSSKHFELKFKYINSTNNLIYKDLIRAYLTFPGVRFCALVIDRQDPNFPKTPLEPWSVYIHRASMLIANNIKELTPCTLVVLADDLTRPKNIKKSFEKSLADAVAKNLEKKAVANPISGISRLESHSSLMIQVVDILLGAVMYDFKKKDGITSENLEKRQEPVVEALRNSFEVASFATNQTYKKPNYFSVWQYNKK